MTAAAATATRDLAGARVGLLEARRSSELAELVRRMGGEPVSAPALREESLPARPAVEAFLRRLTTGDVTMVVFLTGAGVQALFDEADRLDRVGKLTRLLPAATLVSRGPKPAAALARYGLRPAVSTEPPHTSTHLLAALSGRDLTGARLTLVHYGERNEALAAALSGRGARVDDLLLYEWRLPEDVRPLERIIEDILAGALDVVAFTSQVQARHLFEVAGLDRRDALRSALNERILVGAIGPTCADALVALGVVPGVVPDNPKLRPLLSSLASSLPAWRSRRVDSKVALRSE